MAKKKFNYLNEKNRKKNFPEKKGVLKKISQGIAIGLTAYGSFFVRLADLFGKEGI